MPRFALVEKGAVKEIMEGDIADLKGRYSPGIISNLVRLREGESPIPGIDLYQDGRFAARPIPSGDAEVSLEERVVAIEARLAILEGKK